MIRSIGIWRLIKAKARRNLSALIAVLKGRSSTVWEAYRNSTRKEGLEDEHIH
jgi:hypothetical protein